MKQFDLDEHLKTEHKQNAVSAYQQNEIFNRPHTVSWHAMGDNMIACIDWQEG